MKRFALSSIVLSLAALTAWAAGGRTPMPELISPDFLDMLSAHVELDDGRHDAIKALLDASIPAIRADWQSLRELERKADELRDRLIKNEGRARAGVRDALRDKKQRKRFDRLVRRRSKVRSTGLKNFLFGSGEESESTNEYDRGEQPGINMNED